MTIAPIGEWPGAFTRNRARSMFSAPWRQTLELLGKELGQMKAKNVELLVAIEPSQFRLDGYPRSTARAEHPGIILSFDSTVGHLSYPCDAFDRWEDNLRACALALEALRKVDRYGVTKRGEQYRGFLALEATAMPASFTSDDDVRALLERIAGGTVAALGWSKMLRRAQAATHADTAGPELRDEWDRVARAETYLREHGLL
jgi:hypothetical protein